MRKPKSGKPRRKRVNRKLRWSPMDPLKLFQSNAPEALRPYIQDALGMFSSGDLESGLKLLKRVAVPEFWDDAESYSAAAQAAALVSKIPFPGYAARRYSEALDLFKRNEQKCKRLNKKLAYYFAHWNRMPEQIRVVLSRARANIGRVLGDLDDHVYDRIISRAHFGKGMSQSSSDSSKTTICYKLLDPLTCTRSAVPYFADLLKKDHHWASLLLDPSSPSWRVKAKLVESSRVTFVPKDALRLRSIAIEPAANIALQLGCNDLVAYRLARVAGISVFDQTTNQTLARVGSEDWKSRDPWCTIDLSNASDLISKELVKGLLPNDWFHLFNDLRTQHFEYPGGETLRAEKFSSMGNGVTFALETLVFWALAQACSSLCDESNPRAYVYGDDIIVRRNCYLLLVEAMQFVGLEINLSKSFAFGPFRESCGEDWYGGHAVRPLYVRNYSCRESDAYMHANRFRTRGLHALSAYFRNLIPESDRLYAPFLTCPDDGAIHCSFELAMHLAKSKTWDNDTQTWRFTSLRFKPRGYEMDDYVRVAAWLRSRPDPMTRMVVTRRDRGEWRLGKVIS